MVGFVYTLFWLGLAGLVYLNFKYRVRGFL